MKITEIKKKLGIETLSLTKIADADEKGSFWLKNWDNDERRAVLIPETIAEKIKANPDLDTLVLTPEVTKYAQKEDGTQGDAYVQRLIIEGDEIVMTL